MSQTTLPPDPLADLRAAGRLPRPPYAFPALPLPWRLWVLSSERSAGYADFCATLAGVPGLQIRLQPVALTDPRSIYQGLAQASQDLDATAVVLVRGGGEGLAVFDDPLVLYGLAECPHYTLLGVGHASDTVLAGQAVDHEAITPTAAAQFLLAQRQACPLDAPPSPQPPRFAPWLSGKGRR
jgi:exonuclease VII large subunit